MTFAPVLPVGGYAGWGFLKRTAEVQKAAFAASPDLKRDEVYFRERIGSIDTAEQLVADRRLLKVALGAFGLDADINSKFFIRKVLEDGTLKEGALATRLADKQYQKMSAAFGFGDFATPRTKLSDFADKILSAYATRQFEIAVGAQNDDMRLALNAERELTDLAAKGSSEDTKWFTILGSAPLRRVFEGAFNLPRSFAAIDLDQQLQTMKDKADRIFGSDTISQFTDPDKTEALIRRFLLQSEVTATVSPFARGAGALQLLQSSPQSAVAGVLALLR